DGSAITSLAMGPVKMPANSGATFTPNATNTGGTFSWAPGTSTGSFQVRFVAANTLQGSATTSIQVAAGQKATAGRRRGAGPRWPRPRASRTPGGAGAGSPLALPEARAVAPAVFDTRGRRIWQESRSFAAGRSTLSWDGRSSDRQRVGTGIYLVRARVGGTVL